MQQSAADSRADKQYSNEMAAAKMQREWQLEDRDEARAYSRQVLSHLVTDAEAAGFNPLSVLRNGGASNYNAAAGFAPLSRQAPVKQEAGDYMGAAVSGVADFLKDFDPFADDKREQESRLIESQIAALNAGGLSGVKHGRGNFASGDFDRTAPRKGAALSNGGPFQDDPAKTTNPWGAGDDIDRNVANGDAFETRYGDFWGAIAATYPVAADAWHNAKRAWNGSKSHGYVAAAKALYDRSPGLFPSNSKPEAAPKPGVGAFGKGGGW